MSITFDKFCADHGYNLAEFPELQPPLWACYRRARAGGTVTAKTIAEEVKAFKAQQADEQSAQVVPLAKIVTGDLAASHKVLRQ
jgi:hypothetical protein